MKITSTSFPLHHRSRRAREWSTHGVGDLLDGDARQTRQAAWLVTDDHVHGRTISGASITDTDAEALAEEAAAGYDVQRPLER
jgi:hypothetical protein